MINEKIAIIPARGGSKRCPGKNTAMFKNKPLVAHSIEQAIATKLFDRVVVSSDDPTVLDIARQYDQVVINWRDPSLATDSAPLIDVIRNIILQHDFPDHTILCLLQVTAPLREVEDILKSHNLFAQSNGEKTVVSVTMNESPVQLAWRLNKGHLSSFCVETGNSTRKQDYETTYRWNDAVLFDTAKNFQRPGRNLFGSSPIPYIMPPERSINIDYEFQLKLVQMIGRHPDELGS